MSSQAIMPTPEVALQMYCPLVEGGDGAMPMVLYGCAEGAIALALAMDGERPLPEVLTDALRFARQQFGAPRWLVLSAEGKGLQIPVEDWDVVSGLGNEYVSEHPGSVHLVTVTGYSSDATWHLTRHFERVGQYVLWGEQNLMHGLEVDGRVPNVMRMAVEGVL